MANRPDTLAYGAFAVAEDGTLYAGNNTNAAVEQAKQATLAQEITDRAADTATCLRSSAQVLTSEQQTQARTNIGAAPVSPRTKSGNPIVLSAMADSIASLVLRGATTQSGTGDPSTTNVRPITGVGLYDIAYKVTANEGWRKSSTAKNGFYFSPSNWINPTKVLCEIVPVANDVSVYRNSYGVCYVDNTFNISIDPAICGDTVESFKDYIKNKPFTIWYKSTAYSTATQVYVGLSVTDANGYHGYAAGPTAPLYDGDTVDFATGEGKRKKGYIASYAGEALPGKWTSDRDVYAAGATPTTGAQVVYELATPTIETVPISEPITNAAGTVTVSAENTLDVTIAGAASAAALTTETNERITADTGVRGLTATVEATSTASKAYAIGAYFVYNGLLYKCTVAIAQGKTITPGTNCTATTAGAEISTLNQNLAVGGYTVNSAVVTVVNGMSAFECGNKICILSFNLLISAPAGTSALITGLPKNADSSDTAAICFLGGGVTTIKMSGTTLYLNYLNTASTGNIFGQIVYPI